jgi:hypothetical protein
MKPIDCPLGVLAHFRRLAGGRAESACAQNPKFQAPNPKQSQNHQMSNAPKKGAPCHTVSYVCEIEYWKIVWNLGIEIWDLAFDLMNCKHILIAL